MPNYGQPKKVFYGELQEDKRSQGGQKKRYKDTLIARGRLLVSRVPMREQKNDEKGYFFQARQCAALSSFWVGKMLFL